MDLGNIFILGDSYSTFTGTIPEGYGAWYSPTPKPETDVTKAEQIWRRRLLEQLDGQVIMNDSWSGSTVCCTGYDGMDFSHCAFINRLDKYLAQVDALKDLEKVNQKNIDNLIDKSRKTVDKTVKMC